MREFLGEFVESLLRLRPVVSSSILRRCGFSSFFGRAPSRHELVKSVYDVGVFEVDVVDFYGIEVFRQVFVGVVLQFFPVCFRHGVSPLLADTIFEEIAGSEELEVKFSIPFVMYF